MTFMIGGAWKSHDRYLDTVTAKASTPALIATEQTFNKALTTRVRRHMLQPMLFIPQAVTMEERHVSLFRNGRNQAIRIPREFELGGSEAIIRKDGQRLIIESAPARNRLLALLESWQALDEDFPDIDDPVPPAVDAF